MWRYIMILFLIDGIVPTQSNAQLQKAADYFPLQVGNLWEYRNESSQLRYRIEVVGDTLLGDTLQVFRTVEQNWWGTGENTSNTYHFYNPDSSAIFGSSYLPEGWWDLNGTYEGGPYPDSNVLRFDNIGDVLVPVVTSVEKGKLWEDRCGDWWCLYTISDSGSIQLVGESRHWVDVSSLDWSINGDTLQTVPTTYIRYISGLGMERHVIYSNSMEQIDYKLSYAIVNDTVYDLTVHVDERSSGSGSLPETIAIEVWPNPAPATRSVLLKNAQLQDVDVRIFNILGQVVRTLHTGKLPIGTHQIVWNGRDNNNDLLMNGIYFVTAKTPNYIRTRKIVVLDKQSIH